MSPARLAIPSSQRMIAAASSALTPWGAGAPLRAARADEVGSPDLPVLLGVGQPDCQGGERRHACGAAAHATQAAQRPPDRAMTGLVVSGECSYRR